MEPSPAVVSSDRTQATGDLALASIASTNLYCTTWGRPLTASMFALRPEWLSAQKGPCGGALMGDAGPSDQRAV